MEQIKNVAAEKKFDYRVLSGMITHFVLLISQDCFARNKITGFSKVCSCKSKWCFMKNWSLTSGIFEAK